MSLQKEFEKVWGRRKAQWGGTEVIPAKIWLCSGSDVDKEALDELLQRKITDVLNVADDVRNFHEKTKHFKYHNLNVRDFGQDKGISRVFEAANAILADVLSTEGKAIVVHCAAGQNRSVTIILAFLMKHQEMSLQEAYFFVKEKRRCICPLKDNRKELIKYEIALNKSSTMNEEDFTAFRNLRLADIERQGKYHTD
eukprot:TRINITY_DN13256_c0_g1_i1.p1 TRINITY_DN13256_c0_g1~~TRINITY_DN13256_c0_g1_i1.p1  ORF type:complete len:197 (+),score=36.95 TRINITY_DN13256_c0_g1_i1:317-907(+)